MDKCQYTKKPLFLVFFRKFIENKLYRYIFNCMSRNQKFKDIADEILRIIKDRNMRSGDRLPSEKQLAELYGVSHLTVRRALDLLAEKDLIHKRPSRGNFVGKGAGCVSKTGLIGVLFPEDESFFYEVLSGLESRMSLFGYSPVVHISRRSSERERQILASFMRMGVEGIVAAPNEVCAMEYAKLNLPVVFFDTHLKGFDAPYVLTDDLKGASDAVAHLVALGHKRIAYVGGKNDLTADLRLEGYKKVLREAGVSLKEEYILEKEYSRQWGYNAAGMLFSCKTPPTALFCGNDTIASGVLAYMSNRGMHCPNSLSIVGFGNLDFSEGLGLTTVSQSCHEIADAAWKSLRALMNGDGVVHKAVLPTSLIVRRSSAPPLH
jgi:DNA-binding LacI/PurR family transcriptional regulator